MKCYLEVIMIVETERLVLRPWKESDAQALYKYAKDERIGPIAGWPPHKSVEESRMIIQDIFSHPHIFAVTLKGHDEAIGLVGYLLGDNANFEIGVNDGEISYWIGVPFWGKGLIPEATKEMLAYGFNTIKLDNIWCGYYADNEQSHKAQAKCGFIYQRTEENIYNPVMDDYRTEHITRITKDEWSQ